MSQLIDPNNFQVGDYIDIGEQIPTAKVIVKILPEGVQLKDPSSQSYSADNFIQSFSKLRLFRTRTKLKEPSSTNYRRKVEAREIEDMTGVLEDIIAKIQTASPKELMQTIRGKIYYFALGLLTSQIQGDISIGAIISFFKMARRLFLKYIVQVDFAQYNPADIYSSSMNALCSCYLEVFEILEISSGFYMKTTDCKTNNQLFFKNESHEKEIQEWVQCQLLPFFVQAKHSNFPIAFQINLIVLVVNIVKKVNLETSEPLIEFISVLYEQILEQINQIVPNHARQIQIFLQNMSQIFRIMYAGTSSNHQLMSLESSRTQKMDSDGENIKIQPGIQKMEDQSVKLNSNGSSELHDTNLSNGKKQNLTQLQYIKIKQIQFRVHLSYAFLLKGIIDRGTEQITICFNQINRAQMARDPKIKEDKMHFKQNWPIIAINCFTLIEEKKILQLILGSSRIQQFSVTTRSTAQKMYIYLPKYTILSCLNLGRFQIIKNILNSKIIKEDICDWLFSYLVHLDVDQKIIKPTCDFLKFLAEWIKNRPVLPNYVENRKLILQKILKLGSQAEHIEFNIFESFFNPQDNIKVEVFQKHCQKQILPHMDNLLQHFQEYLLAKYCLTHQITLYQYQKLLTPMLVKDKDQKIYQRRKSSIIAVLHLIHNRPEKQRYFTYLKLFIKYYSNPEHDRNLTQNDWNSYDFQPRLQSNQVSLITTVDQQFCIEIIPKLLPLSSELDIKLFNELIIRYNFIKGHFVSTVHKWQIQQVAKVPLYFEDCVQAYFYLGKQQLKIHQQFINEYFLKASEEALNSMLKTFLQIILHNECSVKQANESFKLFKTRYQHFLLSQPVKTSNLVPHDYKIRFHNRILQKKLDQLGQTYNDNEYRQLIIEEEKKSPVYMEIKNSQTIAAIKYKLAYRINRQPSEIFFLNNKMESIIPQIQAKTFGMSIFEFIQQTELQRVKANNKLPIINIYFALKPQKSAIQKSLMEHADELFNQMPKSWLIFQGIDLKIDNWAEFDRFNKIANSFEKAISADQIVGPNFRSIQLQSSLLDYFLWRKDEQDLKLYDFRALFSLSKKIEEVKNIYFNLKIAYLIFASGNFRPQDRQQILNLLLFVQPQNLDTSRLDQEQSYIKLSQLVYRILESKPQGALEFCFTTNFLQKLSEAEITQNSFKKYWIKVYQEASFSQKSQIFQNIEQRFINFPKSMKQLGEIIQDESICQFHEKNMYEKAIQKTIRFALQINRGNPLPPPFQTTQILLINCAEFLKKQFRHSIIESRQFLSFLMQHIYEYIFRLPQSLFVLIFHSIFNHQNRNQLIQFFTSEINQKEWSCKQLLDLPKRYRQYQTEGLVGLVNTRNVCFANSLFQQLYHNKRFCQELLAVQWEKQKYPQEDLILQLKKIFLHLKESRQPHLNSQFFDQAFKLYGSPIQPYTQMDVDEFRNALFSNLEHLLPKNIFWNKLFLGKQVSKITCLQCNNISNTEQTFDSIHLSVQETTLQKSLHQYSKTSILQKENAYSCQKCNKKVRAEKAVFIKDLPQNLVFVLKRFEYLPERGARRKLLNYFEFPFDNWEYFPDRKYNLKGIISHIGYPQSGHYLSYIKLQKKWYEFNDTRVRQIPEEEVMVNTYGTYKITEKSFINERTAYLLFYEAADTYSQGNEMQIECKIVGVEDELYRLRKQRLLISKQRTYFSNYFLQFTIKLCYEFPQQKSFRLLFTTLTVITFKLRLLQQHQIKCYSMQIQQALKLIHLNTNRFPFIWEECLLQKTVGLLKSYIAFQYKAILAFLLVQNFPQRNELTQRFLENILTAIYASRPDVSLYYYMLYQIVRKFQWAEQFVVQRRLVGRILDIVFHGLVESQMRNELKQTTNVPFESGYKVQSANLKEGLRYYRWAMLAFLVQRNYSLLHEREHKYMELQSTQIFQRYFQECKGKVQMRYLNQYLCFLSHHLQIDYTNKLLNSIRDALNKEKQDILRKYLKAIKDLVLIKDDYQEARNQNVVAIFHKILLNLNSLNSQSMEYIWLWLLKIANKNEVFRAKLSNSKVLFDFLVNKSYSNSPLYKFQRLNSYPKTRFLLHNIHIAQNPQQALLYHQAKIQKTKSLLLNRVYEKDLTESDSDCDIADEVIIFPTKIYKFRDMPQDFEVIHVKFAIGDILFLENPIHKQRFPTSVVLYKGDERLYLKNPLMTIDQDQSTPVRKRVKDQAISENNSISSGH